MQRSRLIIGVMGGEGQRDAAQRLGAAITSCGHIVLTGGRNQDTGEAKDAALFGAARSAVSGGVARLVGILNGGIPAWEPRLTPNERSLYLQTGLSSAERDSYGQKTRPCRCPEQELIAQRQLMINPGRPFARRFRASLIYVMIASASFAVPLTFMPLPSRNTWHPAPAPAS